MNATQTTYSDKQFNHGMAQARRLRSLAVIDVTRRLYGLPMKAMHALAHRLDSHAEKIGCESAQCA